MTKGRRLAVDLLLLAVPGGTAWVAAGLAFEIRKDGGRYPDVVDGALWLFNLSVFSFVAVVALAIRSLVRFQSEAR